MTSTPFDLAVIGGGVNGCGIARDAAGRGARVVLIERGDLASGTSSGSTKLIHGGLRYLEHYEFGLVRESLIERERLWGIAPHIIWPIRFVLPYAKGLRPRWMLRAGLFLYDHIGGRKRLPATRSINLRREAVGQALRPEFKSGFEYSDCWVDDARLVILNARDAANRGADIRTRIEVVGLSRTSGSWTIGLSTGEKVRANAVVNAAGPSVLDLLDRVEAHRRDPDEAIRLVRGSHIVIRKRFDTPQAFFFQNPDGRIFFAIPYEEDFALIGTTDADHKAGDPIVASADEIAYLCRGASEYLRTEVKPSDVVWSYAGVRPLVDDGSGKPETASRGYRFDIDTDDQGEAPLLSVFGGKITTYRHLAEGAVTELARWLPQLSVDGWTAHTALPGGDCGIDGITQLKADIAAKYPFLDAFSQRRIARNYGSLAYDWLGQATSMPNLGQHFGHGLTEAEVRYLVDREWAINVEDILWRRTKLGLRFAAMEQAALETFLAHK